MNFYFDRAGNAFHIEDEAVLSKKKKITVTNATGEEFEIDAGKADEYRLTPDERLKMLGDLQAQVSQLGKWMGACPMIDPVGPGVAERAREVVPGGGCPMIDPISIDAIRGSLVARGVAERLDLRVVDMLRRVLDSCPAIDPPRLGAVLGTLVQHPAQHHQGLQHLCPAIDPPDFESIAGTRVNFAREGITAKFENFLTEMLQACPQIDPPRLGSILGSIIQREMLGGK